MAKADPTSRRDFILCSFGLGLLASCLDGKGQTKQGEPRNKLFGVQLGKAAQGLLLQVETAYQLRIREVIDPTLPEGTVAASRVEVDGTPLIRAATTRNFPEELVVHELMHLLDLSRGVPLLGLMRDKPKSPAVIALLFRLYEWVQHCSFYPTMRQMGFAAGAVERREQRKLLETGDMARDLDGVPEPFTYAVAALLYFNSLATLRDEDLALAFERFFVQRSLRKGVEVGKRLAEYMAGYRFTQPDDVLIAFIGAGRMLFEGFFTFRIFERAEQIKGRIRLKVAWVAVEPVQP